MAASPTATLDTTSNDTCAAAVAAHHHISAPGLSGGNGVAWCMARPLPPSSGDPQKSGGPTFTVNERSRGYSSSTGTAPVDSMSMSDTPPPQARWGEQAPEVTIRAAVEEPTVPDIRKALTGQPRPAAPREFSMPGWFGPVFGVFVFVVVLGSGLVLMGVWFSYQVVTAPPPPPPPEEPVEHEGVPVRKGIGGGE